MKLKMNQIIGCESSSNDHVHLSSDATSSEGPLIGEQHQTRFKEFPDQTDRNLNIKMPGQECSEEF